MSNKSHSRRDNMWFNGEPSNSMKNLSVKSPSAWIQKEAVMISMYTLAYKYSVSPLYNRLGFHAQNIAVYNFESLYYVEDRLCGLVVRVLGYRSRGPGSIPGTTG
jgi:hypothetical protein